MRVDSSRAAVIEKKPGQTSEPQHMTRHLMRSTDLTRFDDEWELVAVIPDQGDPAMAFFYFRRRR